MANEQGRYTGTTILATIGEDVGLGQIVYTKAAPDPLPVELQAKGVWYKASSDYIYGYASDGPHFAGMNQLGVVVEAASYSTISPTQSGTKTTILLDGYYSPGLMGGSSFGGKDGYSTGEGVCGAPVYLMPKDGTGAFVPNPDGTLGCIGNYAPAYYGATQGVVRVIGYYWDLTYPFVVRFTPDMTWIQY